MAQYNKVKTNSKLVLIIASGALIGHIAGSMAAGFLGGSLLLLYAVIKSEQQ